MPFTSGASLNELKNMAVIQKSQKKLIIKNVYWFRVKLMVETPVKHKLGTLQKTILLW